MDDDITPYLTPHRLQRPVLIGSGIRGAFDRYGVDAPFVFWHRDRYYMMYVGFDGAGYQTALATSSDLVHWQFEAIILAREAHRGWDSRNLAGAWILRNNLLFGHKPVLKRWHDRYWMVYHAYPEPGYESGPASIGLAWTTDETLHDWNRLPAPILRAEDGRPWEQGGLYKECLVDDGGRFYLFFNAKDRTPAGTPWHERIGLATSVDLAHWERCPNNPVLDVSPDGWDRQFVSDPCVVRGQDRWIMFYFGFDGQHAQEGLAWGEDLVHWTKWPQPILTVGHPPALDSRHAHKPSVIQADGILYHFYCACRPSQPGDSTNYQGEFRCITVAASRPLPPD